MDPMREEVDAFIVQFVGDKVFHREAMGRESPHGRTTTCGSGRKKTSAFVHSPVSYRISISTSGRLLDLGVAG